MTRGHVPKKLASRLRNFLLFLPIAAGFVMHAVPVSADLLRSLPQVGANQNRAIFSSENSGYRNGTSAPLTFNESASTEFFDAAYDESVSTVFTSSNSAFASMLASSDTNIRLDEYQNVTLSGAPGETVTLNLRNFVLRDRATLTLAGTATTSFVINVTKQFSLSGMSKIILSGGVQWNNVFFNVLGSGSTVSLSGKVSLTGTLTATRRVVRLRGQTVVDGKVIARKVLLGNNAQIVTPPVTSP